MYVADLIIWLLNILLKGEVNIQYNVGSEKAISILELALLVNSFQSNTKKSKSLGQKSKQQKEQYVPCIKRSMESLNLELTVNIEGAIHRTIFFINKTRFYKLFLIYNKNSK